MENDCHAVCDAVKAKIIETIHVTTHSQVADILTKSLGRAKFQELSSKLGVTNLHTPT